MNRDKLHHRIRRALNSLIIVILLLVPFHAILTVWAASIVGHYTLLRLWEEVLLLLIGIGSVYLLCVEKELRKIIFGSWATKLIALYIGVQLVWGLAAYATHHVDAKALGYGLIVNVRFLLFFLAAWRAALHVPALHTRWPRFVFWPAVVVVVFGLLQYFALPYDFMKHLGYSASTIYPYETINHNVHYIRIMSSLRGANPLGAYMVVVLGVLAAFYLRAKKKQLWHILLGVGGVLALVLSFSRSAWIGAVLTGLVLLWLGLRTERARRILLAGVIACGLAAIGAVLAFRNNASFQNAFFHTSDTSTIAVSSNQGHESALKSGVRDILYEPLGRGPGTAGPASVYNDHPGRIAENYFIQIGQETGWIGLALFLAINIVVGKLLWLRRSDPLALGLLAALVGVSFVNLLSHAWADETLAYIWWGLAGIALARTVPSESPDHNRDA